MCYFLGWWKGSLFNGGTAQNAGRHGGGSKLSFARFEGHW